MYAYTASKPLTQNDPFGEWAIECRNVFGIWGTVLRHCQLVPECVPHTAFDPIYGGFDVSCYPVWVDQDLSRPMDGGKSCGNATSADIAACVKKNPSGRAKKSSWGSNCQSDTINNLSKCCFKSSWIPNCYAGPKRLCKRWASVPGTDKPCRGPRPSKVCVEYWGDWYQPTYGMDDMFPTHGPW